MQAVMRTDRHTIDAVKTAAAAVFSRYPVKHAFLFGSRARGSALPESDIDVLVSLERPLGLIEFNTMADELSDALQSTVDITTTKAFDKDIAGHVLEDLTPIYERA
jgi:predicted nucleotidyltransferase